LNNNDDSAPVPDKNIPAAVIIIGTFEIGIALLGLLILFLVGGSSANTVTFLTLLIIYGAMGAGLMAIQEWARFTNVVLHIVAIPYTLYTSVVLGGQSTEYGFIQILISFGIVFALTRPKIVHKFQTVVPKKKQNQQ